MGTQLGLHICSLQNVNIYILKIHVCGKSWVGVREEECLNNA